MFTTLKKIRYKEGLTFILLKLLLKVQKQTICNSLSMSRVNTITSLKVILGKKYSKPSNIFTIRRITSTFQYTVYLTGLETTLLLKRISRKVLKLTRMNNSDCAKRTSMKKEFNLLIWWLNKTTITTILIVQPIHSMRLMLSIKK